MKQTYAVLSAALSAVFFLAPVDGFAQRANTPPTGARPAPQPGARPAPNAQPGATQQNAATIAMALACEWRGTTPGGGHGYQMHARNNTSLTFAAGRRLDWSYVGSTGAHTGSHYIPAALPPGGIAPLNFVSDEGTPSTTTIEGEATWTNPNGRHVVTTPGTDPPGVCQILAR